MDFSSIEKQIKKISFMLDTFRAQDDVITPMERELLLDYTRKLYDLIQGDEKASLPLQVNTEAVKATVKPVDSAQNTIVETPVVAEVKPNEFLQNTIVETPVSTDYFVEKVTPVAEVSPVVEQPTFEELTKDVDVSYDESTTMLNEEIFQTFSPEPEMPIITREEIFDTPKPSDITVEGMSEVFAKKEIADLSDKLGFSPIADLTRSMGINDRIRVVKELFNGDAQLFNTTINRLNKLGSYEEAESYLRNGVALDHGWNNEDKIQKAADFVKLIQRRFV